MRRIVIVSADDSHYGDYWSLVKHAWIKLGFEPVMAHVSDRVSDSQDVIDLPIVEGVSVPLQAQVARWYAARFFPTSMCMTSDIDMMPLSKKYFDDVFKECNGTNVVVASSDAYGEGHRAYPMCYNVACGDTLTKLMDLDMDWPEWVRMLDALGWGWNTDERRFYEMLEAKSPDTVRLKRGWNSRQQARARIDRADWTYDLVGVSRGVYIDTHMVRPFKEHEDELKKIFNNIRHD